MRRQGRSEVINGHLLVGKPALDEGNEVAAKHLGAKDHEKLFPDWKGEEVGILEKQ